MLIRYDLGKRDTERRRLWLNQNAKSLDKRKHERLRGYFKKID
jgi:hypothetical protein